MCGGALEPAGTVWCRDCATPHHRDCFAYAGKCAIFGCGCMRFNESPGRSKGVTWIEIKDDDGVYVPQGYVVDFSSRRETFANIMIFVFVVGAFVAAAPPKHMHNAPWPWSPVWTWSSAMAACLCAFIRWNTDDYRVFDRKTGKIWLHQRQFSTVSNTVEADFSEARKVVVSWHDYYHKGQKRTWKVFLLLRDDSAILLMDAKTVSMGMLSSGDCPEAMRETASKVSKLLGVDDDWRGEWEPYRLR